MRPLLNISTIIMFVLFMQTGTTWAVNDTLRTTEDNEYVNTVAEALSGTARRNVRVTWHDRYGSTDLLGGIRSSASRHSVWPE